ncbi:hypothetical protein [Rhizobium paknamense]|uniref:hypothetical protein n=1 Tax=Rhizobium paknamense TaxID=1206817 RepID=UPI0027D903C5|nr:hypothetical protein [Rhizobium paknamense]
MLGELLRALFGVEAKAISINHDQYSLNSLNGFFEAGGEPYFFKFHQEENEEEMSGEYYRADILAKAGLPVDQPLMMSTLPGEQILVYRRRSDPRFSDVLRALDLQHDEAGAKQAVAAERRLNEAVLDVYLKTLHPVRVEEVEKEPIHRLFHDRLVTAQEGTYPGGRLASFYVDRTFDFPGVSLSWAELSAARFVVNGMEYRKTLGDLFAQAHERLAPQRLADHGGVTAHGDAHNANVWFEQRVEGASLEHNPTGVKRGSKSALTFFDPAFAGEHVPALLAEIKATFHNMLAHPFWLYDPELVERSFTAMARYEDDTLFADVDWRLSPVREALLQTKAETLWRPLLAELKRKGLLPPDWQTVIRLALFLCPTLVMNLRAGATNHNPTSSLIGLSVAIMAGSEPVEGSDLVTRFLSAIDPEG